MRKYIFSAMVLVLGLFTVTTLFALSIETGPQQGFYYFNDTDHDPLTEWDDANNWGSPMNPGPGCSTGDETICRIPADAVGGSLQAFLNARADYEDLIDHLLVDTKSN